MDFFDDQKAQHVKCPLCEGQGFRVKIADNGICHRLVKLSGLNCSEKMHVFNLHRDDSRDGEDDDFIIGEVKGEGALCFEFGVVPHDATQDIPLVERVRWHEVPERVS